MKPIISFAIALIASPMSAQACTYSELPWSAKEIAFVVERDVQERKGENVVTAIVMMSDVPFQRLVIVPFSEWIPEFASDPPARFYNKAVPIYREYSYQPGGGMCAIYQYYRPNRVHHESLRKGYFVRILEDSETGRPKGYYLSRISGYFVERSDRGRPATRYFVTLSLRPCQHIPKADGNCT